MGWVLLQTLLSLAAVLALMVAVIYAMKRWLFGAPVKQQSQVPIEILGYRTLQPKRAIYVLQVQEKTIVVGVSEAGFQPLCELEGQVLDHETNMMTNANTEMSPSFLQFLKENLGIVRTQSASKSSRSKHGGNK